MLRIDDDLNYEARELSKWVIRLASGHLALPTFQRGFVWKDTKKIKALVESLLRGRPVGTLLLIPDDPERFASRRPLRINTDADLPDTKERVLAKELVLDGQQRLTALWKALKSEVELFVKVVSWDDEPLMMEGVFTKSEMGARAEAAFTAPALHEKRCFPFNILGIDKVTQDEDACWLWCNDAMDNDGEKARKLWKRIVDDIRNPLHNQKIWHLTLPADMPREDAIDIFIKSNDVSVKVTKFDICVAQCDLMTEGSLRDDIFKIITKNEELIRRYYGEDDDEDSLIFKLGELFVKVACLWADLNPTEGNYTNDKVKQQIQSKIQEFHEALVWALGFYAQEGILERKFVPSDVPLRVLPALYSKFKDVPQRQSAAAVRLRRAYLWRAFLTERYSEQANTRLRQDYRTLKYALENPGKLSASFDEIQDHIFDKNEYPPPTEEDLHDLDKPMRKPYLQDRLSRATFAIAIREAKDFATGERFVSTSGRGVYHYHHLFPKAHLRNEVKGIDTKQIDHCLNFALLTDKTNGVIGSNPPHEYIAEFLHDQNEDEVRSLVESHFIPFDALAQKPDNVAEAYQAFIKARAERIHSAMKTLINGGTPSPF